MSYPLESNKKYRRQHRGSIRGIVLHVTAGAQDTDMVGIDGSAAATIRYGQTTTRDASWHAIADSDSAITCLPDSFEAFHVRGYNQWTLGIEICNRDARWDNKPAAWVDATLRNAAALCRAWCDTYGIPIEKASKSDVDYAIRVGRQFGFTYHSYLDPARRIDPGATFPWARFAELLRNGGVLSRGASGAAVANLQQLLLDRGFNLDPWGADGDFGAVTETALRAFQAAAGVEQTGVATGQTIRDLDAWQPDLGLTEAARDFGASILPGTHITPGGSLAVGEYRLIHQGDGNVVLYHRGRAVWATHQRGNELIFQDDGNLVLYRYGRPMWSTGTAGQGGTRVVLQQTDGNLVMYDDNTGRAVWSTGTAQLKHPIPEGLR